jgi:DMSO/TMAO reductase YedYZ molybdopterin-dependent catalytic subunit
MTHRLVPSQIRKRPSVRSDSLRLYRRTVSTDPGELSGFPKPLWAWLARHPPPGPFRSHTWRSPLRGPWLTSVFALVLLVGLPVVTVTGLLSYVAYAPQLGTALPTDVGWLHLPIFDWPTRPVWLYRLNQGLHVSLGILLVPVVLAKLWSVIPKLFTWPPARSVAQVVERLSLALLVGSILFEIITGLLNIQYDYVLGLDFYTAHYYGAWVFIAAFLAHVTLKLPIMTRSLRSRSLRKELRTPLAETHPEPVDVHGLVATDPAPATISRRGVLALVAGGSLAVTAVSVGATLSDNLRGTALLSPRGQSGGDGPNGFPVNKTASTAGIRAADVGPSWRLTLTGARAPMVLDRAALLAMPQRTAHLPIACVEGWSTTQTWTGVRLADLAAASGVPEPSGARVTSLQIGGLFSEAALTGGQVRDADALLALKVNGVDLSLDHGFPARIIVPALPGVHNTKWVRAIEFRGA